MGMAATLTRIKAEQFDYLEVGEPLTEPPQETLDVDLDWESIMYVLGNGSLSSPFIDEIFMPTNALGDEEEVRNGGGVRYHTTESITAINKMIGDLTELDLRKIIRPDKMKQLYRFDPNGTDQLVQSCLGVIAIFAEADRNGDVILAHIG